MSSHAPQQRAQALVAHLTGSAVVAASPTSAASASSSHKVLEQDEGGRYDGDYGFTLDPKHVLTAEQRRQYDEQGFLLIRKLVSEDDIEKWRQRFVAIANGEVEPTPTMLVMRDVAIAKKKEKGEHAITKLQDWSDTLTSAKDAGDDVVRGAGRRVGDSSRRDQRIDGRGTRDDPLRLCAALRLWDPSLTGSL
jgi:hypothetical protein